MYPICTPAWCHMWRDKLTDHIIDTGCDQDNMKVNIPMIMQEMRQNYASLILLFISKLELITPLIPITTLKSLSK